MQRTCLLIATSRTNAAASTWAPLDDDLFASYTDLLRSAGTFLYGRRLYEAMAVWETNAALAAQSDLMADFATAWQAANKVVYSTTLAAVPTAKTRLEHHFDPASVRDMKASATSDLTVGVHTSRHRLSRPGWLTSAGSSSGP